MIEDVAYQTPSSHVAYELSVRSEVRFPELPVAHGRADVVIRREAPMVDREGEGRPRIDVRYGGREVLIRGEGAGSLRVRDGFEITARPETGADERLLRWLILGPGLGTILSQRGLLTLHASAVVGRAGRAAAFVGGPGRGKSTLAASLCRGGYTLLGDDLTAVRTSQTGATVLPGIPMLKLWPESARFLGFEVDRLPYVHPAFEKRAVRSGLDFAQTSSQLARVYVLEGDGHLALDRLPRREALLNLLGHAYLPGIIREGASGNHFLMSASVADRVPVCRLRIPRSFNALSRVVELIDEDLSRPAV